MNDRSHAALVVLYTGEVLLNVELSWTDMHNANFIVVERNDELVVWKERYPMLKEFGMHPEPETVITAKQMLELAADHVKLAKAK